MEEVKEERGKKRGKRCTDGAKISLNERQLIV